MVFTEAWQFRPDTESNGVLLELANMKDVFISTTTTQVLFQKGDKFKNSSSNVRACSWEYFWCFHLLLYVTLTHLGNKVLPQWSGHWITAIYLLTLPLPGTWLSTVPREALYVEQAAQEERWGSARLFSSSLQCVGLDSHYPHRLLTTVLF